MTSVKLARGAHTTVVIASVNYRPDSSNVAGHQPTIATDHGIEVIDPSSCKDAREGASPCSPTVKETKPWSDLGITQPELLHQQKALVRDDDGSWVPVPIASQAGVWLQDVAATSHGFVITESVPSADGNSEFEQLVSSPDGRTWTPLGSIPPIDSVSISGDRVIGTDSKSSTVYTSNDAGETWSEGTALSSLVAGTSSGQPFAMTIDVGPLGYAIVAQPAPGPAHSYLLYSVDGNAWKSTDLASVGAPADGSFASASVGSDHIDVTFQVPADRTGDVVTSWKLTTLVGTPKA
jgi:hypothetical protein